MTIDLSNVTLVKTARESVEDKYQEMDDDGIRNLIEMAKTGVMKAEYKIDAAVAIAVERCLVTVDD